MQFCCITFSSKIATHVIFGLLFVISSLLISASINLISYEIVNLFIISECKGCIYYYLIEMIFYQLISNLMNQHINHLYFVYF
jgi:hypothetical protein